MLVVDDGSGDPSLSADSLVPGLVQRRPLHPELPHFVTLPDIPETPALMPVVAPPRTSPRVPTEAPEAANVPYWRKFLLKAKGRVGAKAPGPTNLRTALFNVTLSFLGLLPISLVHYLGFGESSDEDTRDLVLMIGSFGATAVLLYDAHMSPLAQPRNLIGGHLLGAFIGVCVQKTLGNTSPSIAAPLAVASSLSIHAHHRRGGVGVLMLCRL